MGGRQGWIQVTSVLLRVLWVLASLLLPPSSRGSASAVSRTEVLDPLAAQPTSIEAAMPVATSLPDTVAFLEGSAALGRGLFTGAVRFTNGGPPCFSCHDVAGLPFPHGGALGPNLTGTWEKYGPQALRPVLATLYFPTMVSPFANRPLTPAERADLAAFFRDAATRTPAAGTTWVLASLAGAGLVLLLLAAQRGWPRRMGGVRDDLLGRAGHSKGMRS